MRRLLSALAVAVLGAVPAMAETVVLGLSQHEVAITTDFRGSHLWVFGAVRREAPMPARDGLAVIVTVAGPSLPVDVRRKERRYGIWLNVDKVHLTRVPSFYAVATTGPLDTILSPDVDLRYHISVARQIGTVGGADGPEDVQAYTDALERIRASESLYQSLEDTVALDEQTLFSTSLALPSNIVEGTYRARIFLLRDQKVLDWAETGIEVRKVGLERWLFLFAHQQPFWYGVMSLVIAVVAGWLASAAFRIFQR